MNNDYLVNEYFKQIRIIKLQYAEELEESYFRIKNKGYTIFKYLSNPMKYLEYVKIIEHNQQESYSETLPTYIDNSIESIRKGHSSVEGYTQIVYFLEKDYFDSFPVLSKAVEIPVYVYMDKNTRELVKYCLLDDFIRGPQKYIESEFETMKEANDWLIKEYPHLFEKGDLD